MPVTVGKKQPKKSTKTKTSKHSGFITHKEYKQKLLQDPDVKKAYDAFQPEYQHERVKIKKALAKGGKQNQQNKAIS